jgi:FKBP-type peptidyl-prolyl cis-trans isomerase FklB
MNLKSFALTTALGLLTAAASAQEAPATAHSPAGMGTPLEMTSYAVGADMVRNFKSQRVDFDLEHLILGLRDASKSGPMLMPEADIRRLVSELETTVRRKMIAARKAEIDANQKKSDESLRVNAAKSGPSLAQ